jgi:periplasmic copper chaperone A
VTTKAIATILMSASILAACGQGAPTGPSSGAPMPTPTVSTQGADMPVGTQLSTLSMINAKVRKPVDGRPTSGYLTIENSGATPERLTSLTSPDFARVELHDHIKDGAMMKMVKLDGLDIAPTSQAVMEPGGKHLMLFDAKHTMNNGDSIKVTLTFSNSGPIETNFVVLNEIPRPAATPTDPHAGHDMSVPPKQ